MVSGAPDKKEILRAETGVKKLVLFLRLRLSLSLSLKNCITFAQTIKE